MAVYSLGFMRSIVMAYNPWYCATYETILEIATWADLSADIEKKILGIFSWMPQTIMAVRHPGKRFKFEFYTAEGLRDALTPLQERFNAIRKQQLMHFDIPNNTEILEGLCATLFPALGAIGGSKFLHFSAPRLLPMWDRKIRLAGGYDDSGAGYIAYMTAFQHALTVKENRDEAVRRYPSNIVRGWDIVCMERR
jgi:hypothetical protein